MVTKCKYSFLVLSPFKAVPMDYDTFLHSCKFWRWYTWHYNIICSIFIVEFITESQNWFLWPVAELRAFSRSLLFRPSPVIFHGRQIAKCVSNHCQPWPLLWKLDPGMNIIYCWRALAAHAFPCIFMWAHVTHKLTHAPKSHSVIRMSQSLPFYFSKRKGGEFTKIYLQKVTADSPTLCRFISFFVPRRPPSPLSVTPLSPWPPSLFLRIISITQAEAVPLFPGSCGEQLSACHILSRFAPPFQGEEKEFRQNHGRRDGGLWNNNTEKTSLTSCSGKTSFHDFPNIFVFDLPGLSQGGEFIWVTKWKKKKADLWNASFGCRCHKPAADNPDGQTPLCTPPPPKKIPLDLFFDAAYLAWDCCLQDAVAL